MSKFASVLIIITCLLSTIGVCQQSLSKLKVTVTDQKNKKPTPVRVKITDSKGHATALPNNAISVMSGRDDRPERYGSSIRTYCTMVHLFWLLKKSILYKS